MSDERYAGPALRRSILSILFLLVMAQPGLVLEKNRQ
jgi:hypothetical protein